jgi:hypothetical protein
MGRHGAAGAPDVLAPQQSWGARLRARLRSVTERVALAVAGVASTTLVLAWAGIRWRTSVIAGIAVGVLVLVAAVVAASVPAPRDVPDRERPPTR